MTLPTDAKARKAVPLYAGCLRYFPDALAAVAELSRVGNKQHNPGKPLHWDRSKSGDELDALLRHLLDAGTMDTDGVRHSTKVAWRALANLQKEIETVEKGLSGPIPGSVTFKDEKVISFVGCTSCGALIGSPEWDLPCSANRAAK